MTLYSGSIIGTRLFQNLRSKRANLNSQIDRLFALWQAVNPTQDGIKPSHWFEDLTDPRWAEMTENTPLYPFRKAVSPEKAYWNSNDSRYTKTFGYSYPDIESGKDAKQIRETFKARYAWSRLLEPTEYGPCPNDMLPLDLSKAQVYQYIAASPLYNQVQKAVAAGAFKDVEATESVRAAWQAGPKSDVAKEWFIDVVIEG